MPSLAARSDWQIAHVKRPDVVCPYEEDPFPSLWRVRGEMRNTGQ